MIRVESLRLAGEGFSIGHWFEHIETELPAEIALEDGRGICFKAGHARYLAAWPDAALLGRVIAKMCEEAALPCSPLLDALRLRRIGGLTFAFNYGNELVVLPEALAASDFLVGGREIEAAGVAVWRSA